MKYEPQYKKSFRSLLLQEFQEAPLDAWFGQDIVAAVRDCSVATVERDRWAGTGVPFVKCGRSVRYTKREILNWLERHKSIQSTTQYKKVGIS